MKPETTISVKKIIDKAQQAEAEQDLEQAATLYKQVIKQDPTHENAYERLFIIYRKLKQYKEELKIINSGIKTFENLYKSGKSKSKKVAEISNALLKSTGLADKKGNHLYDPEPIAKWRKRREVVEKKIK